MPTPLEIVNKFLDLTNEKKDISAAAELLTDDVKFVGPAQQASGKAEYIQLLTMFLPAHAGWKVYQQFETESDASVIEDILCKTPAGDIITLSLAEWFKVSGGKIAEHRVYYDPSEFMRAFGLAAPPTTPQQ